MDTRSSERDLDRPSEKGRMAGDQHHQESPDREAPIDELEAIGILGILGTSDLCTSKVRTAKPRWRVWSKAYGSGHLDQGLVKGLAWKAHRQSKNRESRGHKHCVIVNAKTPMEGLATVTRRQVIWIVF
jgi:hypothetical protein